LWGAIATRALGAAAAVEVRGATEEAEMRVAGMVERVEGGRGGGEKKRGEDGRKANVN
jgi:hypothetical protein